MVVSLQSFPTYPLTLARVLFLSSILTRARGLFIFRPH